MSLTFGRDDRQVEITKNISCSLRHFPIDILQLFLLSIVYIDFRVLKDKSGYAQRYLTFLYIFFPYSKIFTVVALYFRKARVE